MVTQWKNNMRHGFAHQIFANGSYMTANMKNGQKYGDFIAYGITGNIKSHLFYEEDGRVIKQV